jgi:hypothetical protein
MKVLICGDREWSYPEDIENFVRTLPKNTTIVEGECRGADLMAKSFALKYHLKVEEFPADWETYGKVAGVLRNTDMLIIGKPDFIVAYHDNLATSKGTLNMISQAFKKNIPIKIYSHNPESIKMNACVLENFEKQSRHPPPQHG